MQHYVTNILGNSSQQMQLTNVANLYHTNIIIAHIFLLYFISHIQYKKQIW